MEPKKNPKKDLNRNSSLYFVLGLLLVMLLTFVALEWKTYEKPMEYANKFDVEDGIQEEDVPIFQLEALPPPPPPILPTEIEVVEDDDSTEETFLADTESNQNTEVQDPNDFEVIEIQPEVDVDWITIEEVPIFPGCENEKDKRACFNEMMEKHIRKHFRYPELAQEMGLQGRVSTQFIIQKDGTIGTIRKRGPHQLLEDEAERILIKLPKMLPGKQRGTPVKVPFVQPITFKLQ